MQAFVWDKQFETGLSQVDTQHQRLVELVNHLGGLLAEGSDLDGPALQEVFHALADYCRVHFADEERLMGEVGVAPAHKDKHVANHRQFVGQVVSLWQSRTALSHPAETLHGFLSAWLTVHILGEDQAMARQIERIRGGMEAEQALVCEIEDRDTGTAVLLDALQRLYGLLSEQNRNLASANLDLESRVAERTRELEEANARLAAEHDEQTALLRKIEDAQQQLLQSEKMAAIGQLAAGVAHEINNPVGFVNSNLGTLQKYSARLLEVIQAYEVHVAGGSRSELDAVIKAADLDFLREDLPQLLAESQDGLARVTKIVQDLKDFSHVDQVDRQRADLNAAMESTLNVVWNELKYKADVVRDYGQIPLVDCVPAQINQVFMNLLVNAAQSIEEHGRITVRSRSENDHVWFEVEDSGRGMSEEVRHRIFEPFYTTKPIGKGTGLGLSISYDIVVKKHHGRIDVRSTPGEGTCFRIWLPVSALTQSS
ncbi:ATP-binding protein [Azonexus sp. IMCC34839]|uniref:ATP-binding protein n=1 Tax=Azonexus sp. IMCC34839 TaxID=3133695 RepID=UPI00399A854A